jgi:predicted TIM-barrel fold metal-dependent hydrolase
MEIANNVLKQSFATGAFAGIRVVDADTHITEWYDLWTSRAPSRLRDRVPQVKSVNGQRTWVIDGDKSLGITNACSAIHKDGSKAKGMGFRDWQIEHVHAGAHDMAARVSFMDETGISAQIAYSNVLGFGGQKAGLVDPDLRLVSTQLFNDAMAEVQEASAQRIFPMALLPWWDINLAVAETRRCHKMGLRGVNTNTDPHNHGLPDLGAEYWYPLWEICTELDMPVNFHIGSSDESMTWFGSGCWPSHNVDAQLAFGSTMLFLGNARVLSNIILSRFLERFPKLKMVSVESGVGWIPFVLEALEYQMKEGGLDFQISPKELFRRQIYACSWFERDVLVDTARTLGTDNIMFETDFPHPTCLYPGALQYIENVALGFTPEERSKVFGGNAVKLYKLPLSVPA